jgi:tetratricopeptide (TPR) repeat protein
MALGGEEPFIGRRAFKAGDRASFFGRSAELQKLTEFCDRGSTILVHGDAGVGKSSLLQAGLTHEFSWQADVLSGSAVAVSAFPEAALPDHNPFTLALLADWSPGSSRTGLSTVSVTDFLRVRCATHDWSKAPVVAIIDQLEEIFADTRPPRHRDVFLDDIATAAQTIPNVTFVLSLRSEYLAKLKPYNRQLLIEKRTSLRLRPLSRSAALEAVRGPATAAGLSFPPRVAEAIVDDLISTSSASGSARAARADEPGVDPTQLQVVCARLWQSTLRDGSVITVSLSGARAHNDAALSAYCTEVIDEVAAEHNMAGMKLRTILTPQLVTVQEQRIPVRADRAAGITPSILRGLECRHLIKWLPTATVHSYILVNDRLAPVVCSLGQPPGTNATPDVDAATHLKAALVMHSAGQADLAENHVWQALRAAAASDLKVRSDAYSLLGNLAFEKAEFTEAEAYYRQAAELSDQLRDHSAVAKLLGAIGRLHARQGRFQAAIEDLQSAVTRLPGDLILQTELAKAFWSAGQSQAAAAVFGTVLTIKPDFPEALAGRGEIQADRGNAFAALDDLRLLRRVRPSMSMQAELRSAYALALARSGMAQSAIEEADAALASADDNGLIFLRVARVVASVGGSPSRADALLRRAARAHAPAPTAEQLNEARRQVARTKGQQADTCEPSMPAIG